MAVPFVRIVSSVFRRFVVRDINLTKTRFGGHSRSAHRATICKATDHKTKSGVSHA
jgi:hypothetical protein